MILKCVGFEVLTVVVIESSIFWDVTPCYLFHAFFFLFGLLFNPEGGGSVFL
jgi:hypothetical protein